MKKRILSLVMATVLIFSFAGCGKKSSDSKSSEGGQSKAESSNPIVGRYMHYSYSWNPDYFVDLYSDGTGYTNYQNYLDDYDYTPVRWSEDKETGEVNVFFPRYERDSDDYQDGNGYYVVKYDYSSGEYVLEENHFMFGLFPDAQIGDKVPYYNVFGSSTNGPWVKMGSEGLGSPYGCHKEFPDSNKTYEDYLEIWPDYNGEFVDGKKYENHDPLAWDSLDECIKDPRAYRDKYHD